MVSPTEPQSSRHQKSISTLNVDSLQNLDHAFNRNRWLLMVVLPCRASIKQTSKIIIYCQWCLPLEPQSNRHQKSMYIPNNVSLLNLHQVDTRNQCLLSILSPYITSIKKTPRNQCLLLMISPYRTSIKYTSKINVCSQ